MIVAAGDLIFYPVTPYSGWLQKLIAWGERAIDQAPSSRGYSHVAIAGPDLQHQYEAWWPRIRNVPIRLGGAEVYSIKDINNVQVSQMMAYCQSRVGTWYDLIAILTLGKIQIGGTEVCSQLAYNAALAAGVALGPPQAFMSPDDDAVSALLVRRNP